MRLCQRALDAGNIVEHEKYTSVGMGLHLRLCVRGRVGQGEIVCGHRLVQHTAVRFFQPDGRHAVERRARQHQTGQRLRTMPLTVSEPVTVSQSVPASSMR